MRPFDVRPTVNLIGPNGQTTALMPDLRGTPKPPFTNTKPPAKRRDLLKATPAGSDRHPKWTRRNREGTIFGNNRVGRRGKPACEACRKRKSKCVFENLEAPCDFCRTYNLGKCIKRLGPKTEALRLCPEKSIPTYDISVPSEDHAALHYLYTNNTPILCGTLKLDVLARVFARVYGPSMSHGGLRHIVIALLMSRSETRMTTGCPTKLELRHVDGTFAELARKLSIPNTIHESDIFVAYLLARWSGDFDPSATEVHVEGVVAIMRHLWRKMGSQFLSSPMAPFWALLRDEILWLTRKSSNYYRLCQEFRNMLGPKTVRQRRQYESALRGAMIQPSQDPAATLFFGRSMCTSVHTMMELARIIDQRYPEQCSVEDPLIESILVELHIEQDTIALQKHHEHLDVELRPLQFGEYVESDKVELMVTERIHDLVVLYVCRLATLGLEAPSIQHGVRSPEGIAASSALLGVLRQGRAFVGAGIQDCRVFGNGLGNAYESYRRNTNWPCKHLLEALLRRAPGDPGINDAVVSVGALALDFAEFQETYLRRGLTELSCHDLSRTCFSPTRAAVAPIVSLTKSR